MKSDKQSKRVVLLSPRMVDVETFMAASMSIRSMRASLFSLKQSLQTISNKRLERQFQNAEESLGLCLKLMTDSFRKFFSGSMFDMRKPTNGTSKSLSTFQHVPSNGISNSQSHAKRSGLRRIGRTSNRSRCDKETNR